MLGVFVPEAAAVLIATFAALNFAASNLSYQCLLCSIRGIG